MNIKTSFSAETLSETEAALLDVEAGPKDAAPAYVPVVGVVAMMAVALPLVFALRSDPQAAQSLSHGNSSANVTAIAWNSSFEGARQIALASGKMMMIAFITEACPACQVMEREIFNRAAIIAEAQQVVALKIDAELQSQIAARYHVEKCPTIVWTDATGNEKHRTDGRLSGYELYQAMQKFH